MDGNQNGLNLDEKHAGVESMVATHPPCWMGGLCLGVKPIFTITTQTDGSVMAKCGCLCTGLSKMQIIHK